MSFHQLLAAGLALLAPLAVMAGDVSEGSADSTAVQPFQQNIQGGNLHMMDGFCHFQGFYLDDPITQQPLTERYVEIVIIKGEIDPPFTEGDDHVQDYNDFYNTGSHRAWLDGKPGLVEVMVTTRAEKPNPDDDRCQLWENVIFRVFNANDKLAATHYLDSELYECPPGFMTITPDQLKMGEWKPVNSN